MAITSATIPPPPRLSGNAQFDTSMLMNWAWDLYRVIAVELEVPQAIAGLATNTDGLPEGTVNLYYTAERVDDRVATILVEGPGISLSYNDDTGQITVTVTAVGPEDTDDLIEGSTNLYFTTERVDDRVAALIQNGTGLTWTYSDGSNTLTGNVTFTTATDIEVTDNTKGLVLKSPDGTRWRVSVNNLGVLTTTSI